MANHNPQTPAQALAGKRNYQKRQLLGTIANLHGVARNLHELELKEVESLQSDLCDILAKLDKFTTAYSIACKKIQI